MYESVYIRIMHHTYIPKEHLEELGNIVLRYVNNPDVYILHYPNIELNLTTQIVGPSDTIGCLVDELNTYIYEYDIYNKVVIEFEYES